KTEIDAERGRIFKKQLARLRPIGVVDGRAKIDLKRCDERGEQRTARPDVGRDDVLMVRVRAVAVETETIEHSRADGRREVAIRRPADLRLAEFIIETSRKATRMFVE